MACSFIHQVTLEQDRKFRMTFAEQGGKTMRIAKVLLLAACCLSASGCLFPPTEIVTTQSPFAKEVPTTLGIMPLLTAYPDHYLNPWSPTVYRQDDGVFISPPAESMLGVTLYSQMMTDLLAGQLTRQGFLLKELPIQQSTAAGEGAAYGVSLGLLSHLNRQYGLGGLLIGNIYLGKDHSHPGRFVVKAAFLKLVDVQTLDVVCHLALPPCQHGVSMEKVTTDLATELARLAGLLVVPPTRSQGWGTVEMAGPQPEPQPEPISEPNEVEFSEPVNLEPEIWVEIGGA
jgi:hypothetical protein